MHIKADEVDREVKVSTKLSKYEHEKTTIEIKPDPSPKFYVTILI